MRIDNDTASYSGSQLAHSHTHHITKCLYEEETAKKSGAGAGISKDIYQAAEMTSEEDLKGIGLASMTNERVKKASRPGTNLIRGIWDAMGDDDSSLKENILSVYDRDGENRGVRAMLSAVRQNISSYIVNKWEAVREKIKVGTDSARMHFGRNRNGFAMSSDLGRQTAGNNPKSWEKDDKNKGTRREQEEIPSAYQADNHLMDSYSKNGEYCKINENLTYHKK